jgi:hypothetical protein
MCTSIVSAYSKDTDIYSDRSSLLWAKLSLLLSLVYVNLVGSSTKIAAGN